MISDTQFDTTHNMDTHIGTFKLADAHPRYDEMHTIAFVYQLHHNLDSVTLSEE